MRMDANASGYAFSGMQRIPTFGPPLYMVYNDNNDVCQALNTKTGRIEFSGFPGQVIQASIDAISGAHNTNTGKSEIYVCDGDYNLESGFAGIDIRLVTNLTLGKRAIIDVPVGYSGFVFRFGNGVNSCTLAGGYLREGLNNGTSGMLYDWSAVRFEATSTRSML